MGNRKLTTIDEANLKSRLWLFGSTFNSGKEKIERSNQEATDIGAGRLNIWKHRMNTLFIAIKKGIIVK